MPRWCIAFRWHRDAAPGALRSTRGRRWTACGLAIVAVLMGDTAVAERTSPPVFGARSEIVSVSVSVTDGHERYVTGLDEADFAVFEDGVPQRLTLFRRDEVPLSVAVMIDGSASMIDGLAEVQAAAIRLVHGLGPRDRAQIVAFADRTHLMQDFTSDRPALEKAIGAIRAQGQTALREAVYEVLRRAAKLRRAEEQRRWAVVLLSDGEDTSSLVAEEDVLDVARSSDVTVHTIGLRPRHVPREARLAMARARSLLAELARETGGEEHSLRSPRELDAIYDRIGDSLRTQYLLGYVPARTHRDGAWRRIVVRLPGRPDLAPRHRRGYFAGSR